ncbi:hypothetical protein PIB30_077951 [Stylosanthes scabra]|uniref:Uncharacterized protein n=1 Tax=Stylosanthes scabra TaxID=79078 RepID=A0ABU6SRD1_9FABA|nr:hypothetical protein [Stylosanthes scabra]
MSKPPRDISSPWNTGGTSTFNRAFDRVSVPICKIQMNLISEIKEDRNWRSKGEAEDDTKPERGGGVAGRRRKTRMRRAQAWRRRGGGAEVARLFLLSSSFSRAQARIFFFLSLSSLSLSSGGGGSGGSPHLRRRKMDKGSLRSKKQRFGAILDRALHLGVELNA